MKLERRMYIKVGRGEAVAHLMALDQAQFERFAADLALAVAGETSETEQRLTNLENDFAAFMRGFKGEKV